MNESLTAPPLDTLQQAVMKARSLPADRQVAHFEQLGMPEIAHWLLQKNWEQLGRQPNAALKELHRYEWAHGLWTRALERLDTLDPWQLASEAQIHAPDVALKTIVQLARATATRIDTELQKDAYGFALGLCHLRRKDSPGYHSVREVLLTRRPWDRHTKGLNGSALRLALEVPDVAQTEIFHDIEQLLNQRHFGRICPFFRWRFQHNIECLRRYTRERLDQPDPTSGLSPNALFAWAALVWTYGGDMWHKLCQYLPEDKEPQPSSPIGAVRLAATAYRQWCRPIQPLPEKRLRIALCVFGQLRDFASAHGSWDVLRLNEHHVHVFVNTWRQTGMRLPDAETGSGCDRVFKHIPFVRAYQRAGFLYGNSVLRTRYPGLHAALSCGREIQEHELLNVYGHDAQCVIEDDLGEAFGADPGNQRRMFRKMRGALQMMKNSGESFDLCILIRPDLLLHAPDNRVDLLEMARTAAVQPLVFNDGLVVNTSLFLDDALAIGRPDVIDAFADVETFTQSAYWQAPTRLLAHRSIAFNALARGLRPVPLLGFRMHGFASEVVLTREQIHSALMKDIPQGALTDLDQLLLSALEPEA